MRCWNAVCFCLSRSSGLAPLQHAQGTFSQGKARLTWAIWYSSRMIYLPARALHVHSVRTLEVPFQLIVCCACFVVQGEVLADALLLWDTHMHSHVLATCEGATCKQRFTASSATIHLSSQRPRCHFSYFWYLEEKEDVPRVREAISLCRRGKEAAGQ